MGIRLSIKEHRAYSSARLQKQAWPHSVHLILIADSISRPCYIELQIRLAVRTLVTASPSVFLFLGSGVLRANTVVVRMDP